MENKIKEIKKWKEYWENKGYTLIKLVISDNMKSKRSFHKNHINKMYWLNYTSVRPKRGKKWKNIDCIRVISLGSYYPEIWGKSWFLGFEK